MVVTTFNRLNPINGTAFSSDLRMSKGRFHNESRNKIIAKKAIQSGLFVPSTQLAIVNLETYKMAVKITLVIS
jgi:hypothetical protein